VDDMLILCYIKFEDFRSLCSYSTDRIHWKILIGLSLNNGQRISMVYQNTTLYAGLQNITANTFDIMEMTSDKQFSMLSQIDSISACSLEYYGEKFFSVCPDEGKIFSSYDASDWSLFQINDVYGVNYIQHLSQYALTGKGIIWLSSDMENWDKVKAVEGVSFDMLVEGNSTILGMSLGYGHLYVSPI